MLLWLPRPLAQIWRYCTQYIHWSHPNLPCLYYYSYAVHALLRMYVCMYAFVYVSMVLYNYSSWMYECVLSVLKLKYLGLPGITTSGWIEISSQVISDALSITWGPVAPLLIKQKHPLRLRLCHQSPKKGVCLGIFIKGIFKSIHGLVLRAEKVVETATRQNNNFNLLMIRCRGVMNTWNLFARMPKLFSTTLLTLLSL